MAERTRRGIVALTLVFVLSLSSVMYSETTFNIVTKVADRLVSQQDVGGYWPEDPEFTGTLVSGLVDAYQLTCKNAYKTAAVKGGNYILDNNSDPLMCTLLGDQTYALVRLSQVHSDPCTNPFRFRVVDFFDCVRYQPGGTDLFINDFSFDQNVTNTVYYLAYYTVAAYYVDAVDKEIWRKYLIHFLAHVDDDDQMENLSVTALGVALWAIAQTGPLDDTPVKIMGEGLPYWNGVVLADLPGMLQLHQAVDPGNPYKGNFYWRFDQQYGLGYTEDDIYGILGLTAAQNADPFSYDFQTAIDTVRAAIEPAVDMTDGAVYWHVDPDFNPPTRPYYASELLMALAAAAYGGDVDLDDDVDKTDLALFVQDWLSNAGSSCSYLCKKTDLDRDGRVGLEDFALLSQKWLNSR